MDTSRTIPFNQLCRTCINDCKQLAHIKIVSCPNYKQELSLIPFHQLEKLAKKEKHPIQKNKTNPAGTSSSNNDTPSLFE